MASNSPNITVEERTALFIKTRHRLGAPVRKVELTDEQLDTLLTIAVEDYVQYQYEWLVDNQWPSLLNQSLTPEQVVQGLSEKTLGVEIEYTYAYSKAVGLQARGPWELKTDFVDSGGEPTTILNYQQIEKLMKYCGILHLLLTNQLLIHLLVLVVLLVVDLVVKVG